MRAKNLKLAKEIRNQVRKRLRELNSMIDRREDELSAAMAIIDTACHYYGYNKKFLTRRTAKATASKAKALILALAMDQTNVDVVDLAHAMDGSVTEFKRHSKRAPGLLLKDDDLRQDWDALKYLVSREAA